MPEVLASVRTLRELGFAGEIEMDGGVAAAVKAGGAVGGQGVYVQTRLHATDGSGDVADLGKDGETTMSDAFGNVELEIQVQSPGWAHWDRIEIYANAATVPTGGSPYLFGATPTLVLDEGDS